MLWMPSWKVRKVTDNVIMVPDKALRVAFAKRAIFRLTGAKILVDCTEYRMHNSNINNLTWIAFRVSLKGKLLYLLHSILNLTQEAKWSIYLYLCQMTMLTTAECAMPRWRDIRLTGGHGNLRIVYRDSKMCWELKKGEAKLD